MGHRLEIYTSKDQAASMIEIAKSFQIEAKVIGKVEVSDKKELLIHSPEGVLRY